ncbi:efflux RND transporter periplasmic adaptor subunit [Geobacter sp. SVR]|uniref:efflux RND transporter periplasmic adaptor subunit n=1 Tax=Geobacter sp. SVR TaxID=2495594 RepID=UPI00143F031D|nr:efflux RND transporter periplasmic adaptor subunit [Geobacter sp. SVR]BCS52053.1 MexH family multidrug efflux RND transporter periplasmic adaptor subunit [Geobacter sp. SVR]GCF86508.1 MexH family multidrug efflux RND transporter periplasmic adaptor subunit [Geobacter sp. SVR]
MKKKRILFIVLGLLVLIGLLAGVKALQIFAMIDHGKKYVPPPEAVTTMQVKSDSWENNLNAVGSLTAVQGVSVSAELAGKVSRIAFEPGTSIKKGDLLLQQDTSFEEAQLPGAVAQAGLGRSNLKRAEQLLSDGIISQADYDTAAAAYRQNQAQVDAIRATIAKKTIRAPFSGQLGIRLVNLGQSLREGDPIVTLQTLDPIFVDFTLPQQQTGQLRTGLPVRVTGDPVPGESIRGRITTVNPLVESDTRSLKLQATLANPSGRLRPGMFVNVGVELPGRQQVLVIPATAVLYAPYSDSVFVVEQPQDPKKGTTVRQQFVRLGEKRGDFVAVTTGLKGGETVVSSGVFKLRNGQTVAVDNKLAPQFQYAPKPENN